MSGDHHSIHEARSTVRTLVATRRPDLCDVAELLTSEVVTNAVVHGGGWFTLAAVVVQGRLRVSVSDRTPTPPAILMPDPRREHGRGMAIVDAVATSWGTQQDAGGKSVWFELLLQR